MPPRGSTDGHVTDSSGVVSEINVFGPFGELDSLSGTTFGYTAQRFDPETSLHYYKARFYSFSLGRFLQPDPLGDSNVSYTYANNSPLSYVDRFGLDPSPNGDDDTPSPVKIQWPTPRDFTSIDGLLEQAVVKWNNSKPHYLEQGGTVHGLGTKADPKGVEGGDPSTFNSVKVPNLRNMTDTFMTHQQADGKNPGFRMGPSGNDYTKAKKWNVRSWTINNSRNIFMYYWPNDTVYMWTYPYKWDQPEKVPKTQLNWKLLQPPGSIPDVPLVAPAGKLPFSVDKKKSENNKGSAGATKNA